MDAAPAEMSAVVRSLALGLAGLRTLVDQSAASTIVTLILEHVELDAVLTVAASYTDVVRAVAHASVGPVAAATDRVRAAVGGREAAAIAQTIAETFGPVAAVTPLDAVDAATVEPTAAMDVRAPFAAVTPSAAVDVGAVSPPAAMKLAYQRMRVACQSWTWFVYQRWTAEPRCWSQRWTVAH